jgi:hypothetical protein
VIQGYSVVPKYEPLPGQPNALRGSLPGGQSGVGWVYRCEGRADDDPATDFDGRPNDARSRRENASVAAIASSRVPGVERRLAPLFRDVSLLPPADWTHVGGRPPLLSFATTWPMQLSWSNLFLERGAGPAWNDLSMMLDQIEILRASPLGLEKDGWFAATRLLTLATLTGERDATAAIASWIERAHTGPEGSPAGTVGNLIALLGPIVPEAQVDLSDLKTSIGADAFARVEEENRSLREPSTVSLSRWLSRIQAPRLVPYLLAKGADPNGSVARTGYEPPLIVAAPHPAMVALLLDHGADVNQGRGGAQTALQAACSNLESLDLLIKRGADVNARAYGGSTALHRAAIGCVDCVRMLLAAGAAVDAVDGQGRTPLHGARIATAKLLLDAGADPNAEDSMGESPYSLAAGLDPADPLRLALEARGGRLTDAQRARRAALEAMMKEYQESRLPH